jgi:hypothetical protein
MTKFSQIAIVIGAGSCGALGFQVKKMDDDLTNDDDIADSAFGDTEPILKTDTPYYEEYKAQPLPPVEVS